MFVTSDLHFFHKRVKEFCPETRPWDSLEEMHEFFIAEWNKCANKPGVKMYHLGDFCFGKPAQAEEIASRLQGEITFISGNHDFSPLKQVLSKYGEVRQYAEVKYNKKMFVMMHYPILDWRNKGNGSIHLFGHEHGRLKDMEEGMGKAMDVGWDSVQKFLHFDEILEIMETRNINPVGHHTGER